MNLLNLMSYFKSAPKASLAKARPSFDKARSKSYLAGILLFCFLSSSILLGAFGCLEALAAAETEPEDLIYPELKPQVERQGLEEIQLDLDELQLASPNVIIREYFGDGSYRDYHRSLAADPIYPASMTKMMSTLVILRGLRAEGYSMHDILEVEMRDVQGLAAAGASIMGLLIGELIPIREALYGILLPSGSDALRLLHRHVHSSEEAFVEDMNRTAAILGMKGTHFANSTGLHDPYNFSTAEDMTLLLHCLLQDPLFRQICGSRSYTTPATNLHPEGIPLEHTIQHYGAQLAVDDSVIAGGKTGWLPEAGYCFTSYALFGNRLIIVSTERALKAGQQILDHAKIYSYLEDHLPELPADTVVPSPEQRWPELSSKAEAGLEQAGPLKPPSPAEVTENEDNFQPRLLETLAAQEASEYLQARARQKNLRILKYALPAAFICLGFSWYLLRKKKRQRYQRPRRL
ncbi:MAG: serine hydrolase [Eubacteriales bacterium]|nr:serine hydrolase [Eubacteriales bacterium]